MPSAAPPKRLPLLSFPFMPLPKFQILAFITGPHSTHSLRLAFLSLNILFRLHLVLVAYFLFLYFLIVL